MFLKLLISHGCTHCWYQRQNILEREKKKKTDDLFFNTITVLFWLPLKVVFVEWHPLW